MGSYVLITGATGGLGKALAAECASRGWQLFLTDVSAERLSVLAQGLERLYGVDVAFLPCDLVDSVAREQMWDDLRRRGVRIRMLMNVAGVDFEGPFRERPLDELRAILRLNVEATVEMTRRVLGFRDPAGTLRIVNVASLAAYYPMPLKAAYAASKRFLLNFSLAVREELRSSGVSVTVLCPGGMATNPDSIRGILAQGFWGRMTTLGVGEIAARTLDHALAGRAVYVPGILNQTLRLLGSLVPAEVVSSLIRGRWTEARRASLGGSESSAEGGSVSQRLAVPS